jgi:hypothetical protein
MQPRFLEKRVEILENTVGGLEELPARVAGCEQQILQLRAEMRSEFSAVRVEMRAGDEETRREMHALHDVVVGRIEETRTQMHVLHEDVIERIKVLGEKWNGRKPKRT